MSSGGDLGVKIFQKMSLIAWPMAVQLVNILAMVFQLQQVPNTALPTPCMAPFVGATFGAHSKDGSTASFYGYDVGMNGGTMTVCL